MFFCFGGVLFFVLFVFALGFFGLYFVVIVYLCVWDFYCLGGDFFVWCFLVGFFLLLLLVFLFWFGFFPKCLSCRFLFSPIFLVTGLLHNSTSELKAENSDM